MLDTSLSIYKDIDIAIRLRGPSLAIDLEIEEIYNSIAHFKAKGPIKLNYTKYIIKL